MNLLRDLIRAAPVVPDRIGSIVIPESVQRIGSYKLWTVLQTGPGRLTKKGVRIPVECSVGDRLVTVHHSSGPVALTDGTFILSELEVVAFIPVELDGIDYSKSFS